MIRSIGLTPFLYTVEKDRENPEAEQTKFWVIPRTVAQINADSSIQMAQIFSKNRKGQNESYATSGKKLAQHQADTFAECVKKIENLVVTSDAPNSFFKTYASLFGAKDDDLEMVIHEVEDPKVIRELFFVLSSDVTAEVQQAADANSRVTPEEKN